MGFEKEEKEKAGARRYDSSAGKKDVRILWERLVLAG